jgi:hypothetical protein
MAVISVLTSWNALWLYLIYLLKMYKIKSYLSMITHLHLSVEVKNEWNYTSASLYVFVTCTGATLYF